MIRITYDREADAAYIYLRPIGFGEVKVTSPVLYDVNFDYGHDDKLSGVEVLSASKLLPKELLDQAEILE